MLINCGVIFPSTQLSPSYFFLSSTIPYYLVTTTYYVLPTTYYLLPTAYCLLPTTSIFRWGERSGVRMYEVLALLLFFPFLFWCSCSSSSRFRLLPFTFFSKLLYVCHLGKSNVKGVELQTILPFSGTLFWVALRVRPTYSFFVK